MASTNRAIDRLDEQKRHELDNLVASWQMERMPLSDADIEVLALYLLGEIDADERRRRLDALFAMTRFENWGLRPSERGHGRGIRCWSGAGPQGAGRMCGEVAGRCGGQGGMRSAAALPIRYSAADPRVCGEAAVRRRPAGQPIDHQRDNEPQG
jgi:hypothetical protein